MWSRKEVVKILNEPPEVAIVFEQKDGTIRHLLGTRQVEYESVVDTEAQDTKNDIVRVFDLEAKGWRSFHVANLQGLKVVR